MGKHLLKLHFFMSALALLVGSTGYSSGFYYDDQSFFRSRAQVTSKGLSAAMDKHATDSGSAKLVALLALMSDDIENTVNNNTNAPGCQLSLNTHVYLRSFMVVKDRIDEFASVFSEQATPKDVVVDGSQMETLSKFFELFQPEGGPDSEIILANPALEYIVLAYGEELVKAIEDINQDGFTDKFSNKLETFKKLVKDYEYLRHAGSCNSIIQQAAAASAEVAAAAAAEQAFFDGNDARRRQNRQQRTRPYGVPHFPRNSDSVDSDNGPLVPTADPHLQSPSACSSQ